MSPEKAELLSTVLKMAGGYMMNNPRWREGQAIFNALYDLRPDLANRIRATKLDPFHDDSVIDKCLEFISNADKEDR